MLRVASSYNAKSLASFCGTLSSFHGLALHSQPKPESSRRAQEADLQSAAEAANMDKGLRRESRRAGQPLTDRASESASAARSFMMSGAGGSLPAVSASMARLQTSPQTHARA